MAATATATSKDDDDVMDRLERGGDERTPLLQVQTTNDRAAGDGLPLKDMREDSIKEKAVAGVAGAGCTYCILVMVAVVARMPYYSRMNDSSTTHRSINES